MKRLLLGAASLALITACAHHKDVAAPEAATLEPVKPAETEELTLSSPDVWGDWGINLTTQDAAVKPGEDFNAYVNGAWISSFEIPADKSRYGSFDLLREKSEQRVLKIINDLAASAPAVDTPEGKIGAIYNAFMDTDAINAAGLAPAQPYF
ncbi:MAG: M13 family metallopeptidase, partial [Alphaproteobacteria bacterium]|nr:M13 family metallopeptidase [Alphaproteobacteria bacterium]